ncbi:MAG: universal stress protein [Salegentibacter sp.]
MRTIIAATDFSEEAENALEYAGALAKETGARILLFNSFELPLHTADSLLSVETVEYLQDENRQFLEKRSEELAEKYKIRVDIKLDFMKDVADQLEHIFTQEKADLILMGMASKSLAQDIFGNTTTAAITKLKYPVLAIPREVQFRKIQKILFACDEPAKVPASVMEKISGIAGIFDASIEIFHVENKTESLQQESREVLEVGFKQTNHVYKNVTAQEIIGAIEKESEEIKADLLVMLPQKYGFWESLIHRSKTRVMASGASLPLLSIPI